MPVSSEEFRDALSRFPAGVTIVTVKAGDSVHGLTVSAFASISPDPPLVAVMVDHRHRAFELLETEGATFAASILSQDQVELSNRFAWVKDEDRFALGEWCEAVTGAPVLAEALAWLDCTIFDRLVAGSHTIYIGLVEATAVRGSESAPLVYWNRGYRRLQLQEGAD
ncbi:MAG: flavin reductase family protein [Acidobacteriota bacterium]|nr:flavin reductase family protein [Acidobacteriota bacterium]